MRTKRARLTLLGVLLAAAAYRAHAAPQDPQPPRPFQTEVNYVRVDMYPTVDGKPLLGLAAEDVEVLEDGAPQKIERFEHVSLGGVRPATTRPEPSTVDEMRRAAQDPRARVFVLFLDPRHVDAQGSMRLRRPLVDALNTLIGGDDLIAVMTPDMSARGLTFTRRTGSIEQMLARSWGLEDWPGSRDPVEARYEACYGPPIIGGDAIAKEMIARRREMLVLDAIQDLVQFLRGVREERKAVIAVTDGWTLFTPNLTLTKALQTRTDDPAHPGQVQIPIPIIVSDPRTGRPTVKDPASATLSTDGTGTIDRASCEVDRSALADLNDELRLQNLMQAANHSNVSFYPVGPGGFAEGYAPITGRRRSLETMASVTDGRAILQPAFLEAGFQRMVEDLSSYYLLGYYSNAKADGRFHRITVRVKRPGVQVRARAGYLAATAAESSSRVSPTVATPDAAEAQLVTRALSPLAGLARERPLRTQAAFSWTAAGTPILRVFAEVPQRMPGGDDWSKGGEIEAVLRDSGRTTISTETITFQPGTYTGELVLTPREALAPGNYDLQVRAKGAGGALPASESIRMTIDAPPLGSGVLFRRRGPSTGNREAPTADPRYRRAERLVLESPAPFGESTARLLDRTGKALTVPVTATIRQDADGSRWRRVEITLAPLAPGDYIIESTAGSDRTLTGFQVVP